MVSAFTGRPVKITMTSPLMLTKVAYGEYCDDIGTMMRDIGLLHHYEELTGNRQIGVGAVDVQDPKAETGNLVAERVLAHRWMAPEQPIITSSCGLNHLPRKTASDRLRAMTEAKRVLGG